MPLTTDHQASGKNIKASEDAEDRYVQQEQSQGQSQENAQAERLQQQWKTKQIVLTLIPRSSWGWEVFAEQVKNSTDEGAKYTAEDDRLQDENSSLSDHNFQDDDKACSESTQCTSEYHRENFLGGSFREVHCLYNYLMLSEEECCRQLVEKYLHDKLANYDWRREKLYDPDLQNSHDRQKGSCFAMADKDWLERGQIELDGWEYLFEKLDFLEISPEYRNKLFECLDDLRQAAVHRNHYRLSKDSLETALQVPSLFGDEHRASEMQRVYRIALQEPSERHPEDQTFFKNSYTPSSTTPPF